MKALLSLIISTALVVSGYAQTRNVLVGTNNAVVQPTNFWSADASNARSGLGLGSAATNPSSAFQPASSILSNLVSGGALTFSNVTVGISNVTGLQTALDGKLGTNPTLFIANISNLQTTLDEKLGTNPTLQISNIAALQTALDGKLSGTFPIAISNVSGLQTSLDGKLGTNPTLLISNISGLQTNLDSKLSLTGNAINLTNFPTVALASNITGTAALASNVTGVVAIANGGTGVTNAEQLKSAFGVGSNDVFVGLSNLGVSSNLGFASTPYILGSTNSTAPNNAVLALNATGVRSVAGLTLAALTNTDITNFRLAIGLGTSATNDSSDFQGASVSLSNLSSNNGGFLTNLILSNVTGLQAALDGKLSTNGNATNLTNFPSLLLRTNGNAAGLINFPPSLLTTNGNGGGLTNLSASNISGAVAITNGGSGATTAGGARTNLGLGVTNDVTFNSVTANFLNYGTNYIISLANQELYSDGSAVIAWSTNQVEVNAPISFLNSNVISITRTNLGLGWPALTNTTASGFQTALFGTGTNPVLVNTNGEVVSPTNFWQVAPAFTLVQNFTNISANTTNSATNGRNLYVYSFSSSHPSGITNTIQLPTNASTINGDVATVIHLGTTSGVTQVRPLGGSNIIAFNQPSEAIGFIYKDGAWTLGENPSFVEPIYFSGINAEANAAASRTNLGLGSTWLTNTNVTDFRTAIGLGAINNVEFTDITAVNLLGAGNTNVVIDLDDSWLMNDGSVILEWQTNAITAYRPLSFNNTTNAATTRTNLGIPLEALTNTSVTNFQKAIFYTNTAPSNIGGNLGTIAAWIEIVASNGITYKIPAYTNVP